MQVWASYLYSRGRSEIIFLSPKLNLITLPKLGKLPCNICQIFLLQNHQIWSIHTMNFQRKMHIQTHQKGTSQSGVFSIGIFGGKYIYKSTKCRRGFRAFFPQYYRYKSQEKRGRYAGFSIRKTMVQIARNAPLLVWNLLQKYSMRFPKSRTFATVILGRKYTCKVARFAHAPAWWDNPHLPRVRGDWKAMNTLALSNKIATSIFHSIWINGHCHLVTSSPPKRKIDPGQFSSHLYVAHIHTIQIQNSGDFCMLHPISVGFAYLTFSHKSLVVGFGSAFNVIILATCRISFEWNLRGPPAVVVHNNKFPFQL